MTAARREAAVILRRLVEAPGELRIPATMAAYLRGHADGLEARSRRRATRTTRRA